MAHVLNWFEIPVTNMDRAVRFYAAVTGTELRRENFGVDGMELAVFGAGNDDEVKGALCQSQGMVPSAQGTLVYLNANPSIDAFLNRVVPAGGTVDLSKTALPPGMGYFAYITDTEGNRVGLHAMD